MNRQILRLAIPNIISNITVPLLGMVDLAILGHLESEIYIGAIALGGLIFNFIYAVFSFLRMGTSGFTAIAYGEKNNSEVIMMLGRALFFALAGGTLLIILQYPVDLLGFSIIDGSGDVKTLAREYYYIRIYAAPASLGILAINGWLTGVQNAKTPMIIAITINIINVLANLFFVYGLKMKSDGVAWGTVIAQYTGFILGILIISAKYRYLFKFRDKQAFFDMNKLKAFFKVNLDIMIRTVCLIFAFAFFTSQSAKINDTILAVNTVMLQYLFVFAYLTDGFAYAAEALVGKFIGAADKNNLRLVVKRLLLWGFAISIPFSIVYFFSGGLLLRILTDNPKVIEAANPYLFWMALIPIATFAAFIWDGIYIGATASAPMRNTLLVATILIFLPAYYLLNGSLENHALWLSMMLFMITRGIMLTLFKDKYIYGAIKN